MTGTSASVGFRREPERRPAVRFFTISGGNADTKVGGDQCKLNAAAALKAQLDLAIDPPVDVQQCRRDHEYNADDVMHRHRVLRGLHRHLQSSVALSPAALDARPPSVPSCAR